MKKLIVVLMVIAVGFGWYRWNKKPSQSRTSYVLPDRCEFFVDENFSATFHKDFTTTVAQAYTSSKNPELVIEQVTQEFPEIAGLQVQICQTDKVCFYADAVLPVFLLNENLVACSNGALIARDHYTSDVIDGLVKVQHDGDQSIKVMVAFVQALPTIFKEKFKIIVHDATSIRLMPIENQNYSCLTCVEKVPSLQTLQACWDLEKIADAKKSKTKRKQNEYDLRFKNQIIVR